VLQLFVSIDTAKIMKVKCHSNTTERKRERVKRDVEEERGAAHRSGLFSQINLLKLVEIRNHTS
jgi:hypothetical protein